MKKNLHEYLKIKLDFRVRKMTRAASQAGDADSSRTPSLNSSVQTSMNDHGVRYYIPDSKWKLGQRWALSCNFCRTNVGCAMQNHRHFAHPKNVGPTCCTNVGPTCCINVGPTCWANVASLLASGSC